MLSCQFLGSYGEVYSVWSCQWADDGGGEPGGGGGTGGPSRQELINQAFTDAEKVIRDGGRCNAFFKDNRTGYHTEGLVNALKKFGSQLRESDLRPDVDTGIKMWTQPGEQTTINVSQTYDIVYRTWPDNRVVVNSSGPFFQTYYFNPTRVRPRLGLTSQFLAGTRRARVLQVLHELAHLIKKADNSGYLIPDDGGNANQSVANTNTVDSKCGAEIQTYVPST